MNWAYNYVMQILIVEDETKIANLIRKGLQEENYSADIASDGEEALYKFDINQYDLVILDLMLPKIDGINVCKEMRKRTASVPIIMLTAKDAVDDRVLGLDAGADDYLIKPFAFSELRARIRALLRRGNKADPTILSVADITLNPVNKEVKRAGKNVLLTAREYALLEYFLRHPNQVLTKTQLLEHVWDYSYEGLSNIVETYIKYLRKKLQVDKTSKDIIHTRRGLGYIMEN